MSNCSLSVKKFKDFNYIDSNLYETSSNINNNYNHNNLIQNDILLVGYRFKDVNDCPEIKIPLKFITTSNQQAIYFQVDTQTNELQYTYDDPSQTDRVEWHHTGVIIPNECNCGNVGTGSLHLYFDEDNRYLYYSQNEITPTTDLIDIPYVEISTGNPTAINTVLIYYDAESINEVGGEFDPSSGVLTLSLYNPSSSDGGGTGEDPVVGISSIDSVHNNSGYTTVTITLTDYSTNSFNIPDGQDGAIPEFRINTNTGNIEYSYNGTNWTVIGQAVIQQGGETYNNTFAFNIQRDRVSCTNVGDAYIDWNSSNPNLYGHLFLAESFESNNDLHFRDLGRIVGADGVSPTITVTQNQNGYTLTIDGTSYQIHNGNPGTSVGQLVYVSANISVYRWRRCKLLRLARFWWQLSWLRIHSKRRRRG